MAKKKGLIALDPEDANLLCPLSGTNTKGRKVAAHILTVVRVCDRKIKNLKSIFACCPLHNVTVFLNDQSIVEELIDGSLKEVEVPAGTRDPLVPR